MLIIVGYARTGSSIIFKSLQEAGFNGGKNLYGHKYISQDHELTNVNHAVYSDRHKFNGALTKGTLYRIETFITGYCDRYGIDLLKSPTIWQTFDLWTSCCEGFKESKFIWTRRNPQKTAESVVRAHKLQGIKDPDTIEGHKRNIGLQYAKLRAYLKPLDSIEFELEDVLDDPGGQFERMSEFVGTEVKPDLIDRNSTFEVNHEVN